MKFKRIINVDTPLLIPMPFSDRYRLERDLELKYETDEGEHTFVVKKGFITDGASIPRLLWGFIGSPYEPRFITAAIVHDLMCEEEWDVALMSDIFFDLLKLSNVDKKRAYKMYMSVYVYKTLV